MTYNDAVAYEIGASWWAGFVSHPKLQAYASRYFRWKVNRKFKAYQAYQHNKQRIAQCRAFGVPTNNLQP